MEMLEPGQRFVPTDNELITEYLDKKIQGLPLPSSFVVERDIYDQEKSPWEIFNDHSDPWRTIKIRDKDKGGSVTRTDRTIYAIAQLKYASKNRIKRVAGCGVWHGEGGLLKIRDDDDNVIGIKKTYSFEVTKEDAASNIPEKGHWIMHEFSSTLDHANNSYVICEISRDDSKDLRRAPAWRRPEKKNNGKAPSIMRTRPCTTSTVKQDQNNGLLLQTKKLKTNHGEVDDFAAELEAILEEGETSNDVLFETTTDQSSERSMVIQPCHNNIHEDDKFLAEPQAELEREKEEETDNNVVFGTASTDQSTERMVTAGFQLSEYEASSSSYYGQSNDDVPPPTLLLNTTSEGFSLDNFLPQECFTLEELFD